MVPPTVIEDGQDPASDVARSAGVQESGSRAVAASRRSYSIKEKRELVQAICTLFQVASIFIKRVHCSACRTSTTTALKMR